MREQKIGELDVTITLKVGDWRLLYELLINEWAGTGDTDCPPIMKTLRRDVRARVSAQQEYWFMAGAEEDDS